MEKSQKPTITILVRGIINGLGLSLLSIAFLSPFLGISKSSGLSTGKSFLALMGIILLAIGLFGPRIARIYQSVNLVQKVWSAYKSIIVIAVHTIAFTMVLEWVLTKIMDTPPSLETSDSITNVDYYTSQEWLPHFVNERYLLHENGVRYSPYVIWRRNSFEGQTINITDGGFRVTPGADCQPGAYRVFVFGGSTTWGTGAPDWETIPAYLQASMEKRVDGPVCVVNYGETAYVSTQGVIQLMLSLQSGQIPDLVIFYQGSNDIFAIIQNGAISHYDLEKVASRFEQNDLRAVFEREIKETRLYYLFGRFLPRANTSPIPLTDVNGVTDRVLDTYLSNYRMVRAIGQEYGFNALFFWQPAFAVENKLLTDEEKRITYAANAATDQAIRDLYRATYERVETIAGDYPNLYYIADIFHNQKEQIYTDAVHITPVGNAMVAQEMMKRIDPLLPR